MELGRKHDKAIQVINEKVKQVAEVGHFKKSNPIRIICDASKAGLGAVLQQIDENNKIIGDQYTSHLVS